MIQKSAEECLLDNLSELYNKCLPLYELITSPRYEKNRVIVVTNELYSLAQTAGLYTQIHPELQIKEVSKFFDAFHQFYAELKQVFFNEDSNTALLYSKLTIMKQNFEHLTAIFHSL